MKKTLTLFVGLTFCAGLTAQHLCAEQKMNAQNRIHQLLAKRNASNEEMKRMEQYDVKFHHLNLNVERTSTAISGNVRTLAAARNTLDTFVFQLYRSLTVDSVVATQPLTFWRDSDVVYVQLDKSYQTGDIIDLVIYYRGTPPAAQNAAIGAGFSNRASPTYGNRITWSLSQPYSAYEWWPCKQSLQDKIDSVKFYITTDTSNKAGSHGILKRIEPLGNGKHRFEWESRYPISYYLIAVAVGQYSEYNYWAKPAQLAGDSIPVINYIYSNPTAFTNNRNSIEATVPQLEMFSSLYGLYPFHTEKYGHMMAPFSGGMEHQTMTSQGVFNFDIVAHELAHQWFGDNVTCASWADLWLNEGFATYSEYVANEKLQPSNRSAKLTQIQNAARSTSNSVWVNDTTSVSRIFNSNSTYQKGAAIIHILRYVFNNDSLFFAMLTDFQVQFKDGNASAADFKAHAEGFLGNSLTEYFNQWYYGRGYPVYSIRWNKRDSRIMLILSQTNGTVGATTVFTNPVNIRITGIGQSLNLRVQPTGAVDTFFTTLGADVLSMAIDPDNWILKSTGTITQDATLLTSVNDAAELELLSYPNPATDLLYIPLSTPYSYTIWSADGRLVQKESFTNTTPHIRIQQLLKGVYVLECTDREGKRIYTSRFIKQ
ncbi:MAG: M1 family aminopeptidase [Bacteroidota bacterium]|jgi:aminopeptidase N